MIKVENSRVKSETRVKRMNKLLPAKNSFLESEIKKDAEWFCRISRACGGESVDNGV